MRPISVKGGATIMSKGESGVAAMRSRKAAASRAPSSPSPFIFQLPAIRGRRDTGGILARGKGGICNTVACVLPEPGPQSGVAGAYGGSYDAARPIKMP